MDFTAIQTILGYSFTDSKLLRRALSHRSWAQLQVPLEPDYERLEYLGDALLGAYIAEWLWRDDPEAPEGVLTRRRQDVVQESALSDATLALGIKPHILLSPGEEQIGGREKPSILADVFEALIAAIYLDGGHEAAQSFATRALFMALKETRGREMASQDWKTMFQEQVQSKLKRTPVYRTVASEGPPHKRTFEVVVEFEGRILGRGIGKSKKQAEQMAAKEALDVDAIQKLL